MPQTPADAIDQALATYFGFNAFRTGQREIVESVVDGKDTLVVMPTGAGKSLCYQLPACMSEGVAVVVSPLIALMKDQVDAAVERGIPAACINSSMEWSEQRRCLRDIEEGRVKLVYVAPERFANEAFMQTLSKVEVALFAVDEAHCISQWGHDFRPDYLNLGDVRETLGNPTTLALTATATPEVQADILEQLCIREARVIVSGFERPNLFFEVHIARTDQEKFSRMLDALEQVRGQSAVVYCSTRKQVEEVRARLLHAGHVVDAYHAGLNDRRRADVQDAFMAGDIPVLVATNAFGMGVDKSDVRAILHYSLPGSLEAYYQEAGRAGRDGEPSRCLLFFNPTDRGLHEFFIDLANPPADVIMSVWSELRRYGVGTHALGADLIAGHINRSAKKGVHVTTGAVEAALRILRQAMHLKFGWRDGFPWLEVNDLSRVRDLRVEWDQVALRREIALRQLDDMVRYATRPGCRQAALLDHFRSQASFHDGCDHCDHCCGPIAWEVLAPPTPSEIPDSSSTMIRKALSGVARVRSDVGLHVVVAMLRGSTSRLVSGRDLDRLTTYGILDFLSPERLVFLLESCERFRLVTRSTRGHVALTDEGVRVMRGDDEPPAGLEQRISKRMGIV